MKSILAAFLFFIIHFSSVAQFTDEPFFVSDYNDSNFVKNRGLYLTFSPISLGTSVNTDNDAQYRNISMRFGVHWMTKNYQKFQWFAAYGNAYKRQHQGMTTFETGLMLGKIIHGRRSGYLDLNVGVAYFSRIGDNYYYPFQEENMIGVYDVHTVGIPFEAMVYTSKSPIGIGVGFTGNLNANQPYVNFLLQFRLGNPILRKHAIRNRYRII